MARSIGALFGSAKRVVLGGLVALLAMAGAAALAGCGGEAPAGGEPAAQGDETATTVRIGTMPTEDSLPLWVAEADGLFADQGVQAEIVTFDSAPALSAAITAGQVDMAMTDVMRAVKLTESGTPVVLEWITLGETATEGRFGVMAPADAPYSTLEELAAAAASGDVPEGFGVGVAANTVPEYVLDALCAEAGLPEGAIPTQEVASLPERYSLMASGQLAAAALPGSLLALGEANGMKLLADDTTGQNVSQSVMVAQESFEADHHEAVEAVALAWNAAADAINADRAAYLPVLAEEANLNETIAESYPVSTYPYAFDLGALKRPLASLVEPQIAWMAKKGYGTAGTTYDEASGAIVVGSAA